VSSEISDFTPCAHAQINILQCGSNTLRKLMIEACGLVFRQVCRVRVWIRVSTVVL